MTKKDRPEEKGRHNGLEFAAKECTETNGGSKLLKKIMFYRSAENC